MRNKRIFTVLIVIGLLVGADHDSLCDDQKPLIQPYRGRHLEDDDPQNGDQPGDE